MKLTEPITIVSRHGTVVLHSAKPKWTKGPNTDVLEFGMVVLGFALVNTGVPGHGRGQHSLVVLPTTAWPYCPPRPGRVAHHDLVMVPTTIVVSAMIRPCQCHNQVVEPSMVVDRGVALWFTDCGSGVTTVLGK